MRISVLGALAICAAAGVATAQPIVLEDFNSQTVFDLTGGNQISWTMDGQSQLFNQRFFFRTAAMADEAAVDSLPLTGVQVSDTNFFDDARNDTISARYNAGGGLEFRTTYTVRGGLPGSGTSDLAETIRITNSGAPVALSFFQYVDFDLGGTSGGDFGQILNGRTVRQADSLGTFVVNETVVTPAPDRFDLATFPGIAGLFFDGLPSNLGNNAGPIGPTDVTWAFQWDIVLNTGDTFTISKDKLLATVPAPSSAAVLGLIGLAGLRRRR